jgi:lysophospholipid acyltransferase (LPLAT)-like uncharacterized protein
MRKLIRHPAVQAVLARMIGAYLAFALRTTRWRMVGGESALVEVRAGRPLIIAFWHERLPVIPVLFRLALRDEPLAARMVPHVLVSQHRDGRFIGAAVARFGFRMVYGSSSRGGGEAMVGMLRVLRDGNPVAITPDGPRGPRRQAAPGVVQLAARSGAMIAPVAGATTRHRILPSWDRMMLPLPFGRGVIVCGPLVHVPRDGADAALPTLAAELDAACALADAEAGISR